jgi:hypothetical protein
LYIHSRLENASYTFFVKKYFPVIPRQAAQIARRGRIEIAHSSTFHTFDALPR